MWSLNRRSKYGAIKVNGFDSKLEWSVYQILCARVQSGELKDLKRQHTIILQDGPRDVRISWRVDFSAIEVLTGRVFFCEAKGHESKDFKIKLKMFKKNPQGVLEIWGGDYRRPFMKERI